MSADRRQRMLSKFRAVTTDRLARLHQGLEQLEAGDDDAPLQIAPRREIHTLKGEARMMKQVLASQVAHRTEDLLLPALESGGIKEVRDRLVEGLDLIAQLVEQGESQPVILRAEQFLTRPRAEAAPNPPRSPRGGLSRELPRSSPRHRVPSRNSAPDRRERMLAKLRTVTRGRLLALSVGLSKLANKPGDEAARSSVEQEILAIKGETRLVKLAEASEVAATVEARIARAISTGDVGSYQELISEGLRWLRDLIETDAPYPIELTQGAETYCRGRAETLLQAPANKPLGRADDFVRVDHAHLAALTNVAGELLIRHEQLERSIGDLQRIADALLGEVEQAGRHAATQDTGAPAGGARRESATRLHAYTRELISSLDRARDEQFHNRLNLSQLQSQVRQARMVRVSDLFERHARSVRDLAREQGKSLRVRISGAEVTVDKQVLDHLEEPLLHLCRNAVDHGIEAPQVRRGAGKDDHGEIRLIARESGGLFEVVVEDDGRGIDTDALRRAALNRGLLSLSEASSLDQEGLFRLLFLPGFSTREKASDLSGRGVGLDVVSTELAEIGGTVQVESQLDRGSRFVLRCPISTAFAQGLVIKASDELYAIASASVEEVLQVPARDIERTEAGASILIGNKRLPVLHLSGLLQTEVRPSAGAQHLILLKGYENLALQVDDVIGEREGVRRNLNRFISGVDIVSGTALVEGQRLVMFLHLPELFRSYPTEKDAASASADQADTPPSRKPRILLVDDSELTREMLASLLERLDFAVSEAVDGADALRVLADEPPDLVLTDLDMPILDGLRLVRRIRQLPEHVKLPVIVFSTRGSEDDRRDALAAGADSYMVKAAFSAGELHRVLQQHLFSGDKR